MTRQIRTAEAIATKVRVDFELEKQMKTRDEDKTNNAIKNGVWLIKINPTLHIINNKEKNNAQ